MKDAAPGDPVACKLGRVLRRSRGVDRHADRRQVRRGRTRSRVRLLAVTPEEALWYQLEQTNYTPYSTDMPWRADFPNIQFLPSNVDDELNLFNVTIVFLTHRWCCSARARHEARMEDY